VPEADVEPILAIACPNILFPYVRETISEAITRGGFTPVLLSPVNFEALYQQRLEQAQSAAPSAIAVP
jgi:preprotein translocase subunit SecB